MKTIIYSNNNFQALLCLEAVRELNIDLPDFKIDVAVKLVSLGD